MKRLICIYDSKLADKGTYYFMKAIEKEIKGVEFLDVNNPKIDWEIYAPRFCIGEIKTLALRPMKEKYNSGFLNEYIRRSLDNKRLPLVVEAILRTLGDVRGKEIVVINQSENLGIPLVAELMIRKAIVKSIPRHKGIFHILNIIESCDILISATGDDEFKITEEKTNFATDIAIDLSNDIGESYPYIYSKHVRKVPIVEVLKERLS